MIRLHVFLPARFGDFHLGTLRETIRATVGGPHDYWPMRHETPPEAIERARALVAAATEARLPQAIVLLTAVPVFIVQAAVAKGTLRHDEVALWRLLADGVPTRLALDACGRHTAGSDEGYVDIDWIDADLEAMTEFLDASFHAQTAATKEQP